MSEPGNQAAAIITTINDIVLEISMSAAAGPLGPRTREMLSRAIRATDEIAGPLRGGLGVLVEDDAAIRDLNRIWRGIDEATNVLAFPFPDPPASVPKHFGDIAISYETAAREASAAGKPFAHHLAHLAVHGFLHLLGHDHQSDLAAEEMEHLERRILARVPIPDPYADQADADHV